MDAALGLLGAVLVLHALESPRPLPAVAEPVLQRHLMGEKQTKQKTKNKNSKTGHNGVITYWKERNNQNNEITQTMNKIMEIKNARSHGTKTNEKTKTE